MRERSYDMQLMFGVLVLAVAACWWGCTTQIKSIHRPGQQDWVVVVRKDMYRSSGGVDGSSSLSYFVSFKFPDGSKKTFNITAPIEPRKYYDSIQEGETGILTRKDKTFMSFEKDPEYGGLKVDTNLTYAWIKKKEISELRGSLLCYAAIFIFILWHLKHLQDKRKKMYKT